MPQPNVHADYGRSCWKTSDSQRHKDHGAMPDADGGSAGSRRDWMTPGPRQGAPCAPTRQALLSR